MWKDFKKFVLRGNTVDVAVAFVVGAAFNGMIQALVKDMLTPLIAAIVGNPDFSGYFFTLHGSRLLYGDFVNTFISFFLVACAVFFLVVQPINKMVTYASKLKTAADPTDKKCPECLSTIPIDARRCAFCTSKLHVEPEAQAE